MAIKGAPTGLFAKVAQFMGAAKEETPTPPDSEQSIQSGDSELEKQQLQARIESKRRDDQIRRMEFNHLRKLRGHDKVALGAMPRVSGYEDSSGYAEALPSSAKRERTVSKINAIEAHLSDDWRKRRLAEVEGRAAPTVKAPQVAAEKPPLVTTPVQAEVVANAPPLPAASSEVIDSEMDLDFTSFLAASPVSDPTPQATPAVQKEPDVPLPVQQTPVFKDSGNSSFTDSRIESVELGSELDNPALHDAAIRFADGDAQGAEAVLISAMQDAAALAAVAESCAVALLDLYRATDQAAAFDVVAIEFAQRFGRSAPEWFSVPALLELHKSNTAHPREMQPLTEWHCPRTLDAVAVAELRDSQVHSVERHVQWEKLESIEASALVPLTHLFTDWASKPLALSSRKIEVLNSLLEQGTPIGDASVDSQWWLCRLECLRIQGQHETYDTVALDYCVTYEVSPPSWVEADCTFTTAKEPEDGPDSVTGPDSVYSTFGDTRAPQTLELSGEIVGDSVEIMRKLSERMHPGEDMVISCARLIRIDFSAAGSLLNWLAERSARDGIVEFVNVPRLVATFFAVMGINKHATVVTRTR